MPTLVFGDNTGDDYSGTDDCYIRLDAPTTNYDIDGSNLLKIAKYDASIWVHILLRFTGLSNLPSSISVSSAYHSLYVVSTSGSPGAQTAAIRYLKRAWVAAQATWNIWSTGNSWTTAGATDVTDRDSTTLDSITYGSTTGQYYDSADSAGMRSWLESVAAGSLSNDGHHFERSDGQNDSTAYNLRQSEGTDGQRPYQTVVYTEVTAGGVNLLPLLGVG